MPIDNQSKFASKPSLEESQREAQEPYGEIISKSQTRLAENIKFTKDLFGTLGTLGGHLDKTGKSNNQEREQMVNAFEIKLKGLMEAQPNDFARLKVILEETADIKTIINKHKRKGETHYQSIYESILSDIIQPREELLLELAKLEAIKGGFNEVVPVVLTEQKVTEALNANTGNAEDVVEDIEDKPLLTRTGNLMNNAAFIGSIRKFKWSDERIPDWIAEYMLNQSFVREGQATQLKTFLSSGKSTVKILWGSKANVLTTIFYELIINSFLTASKTFIAEKIERVFVSSSDSLKPLISRTSIMEDLKPTNTKRRVHKEARHYPDVINYLEAKILEVK